MAGSSGHGTPRTEFVANAFRAATRTWPHINISRTDFEAYVSVRAAADDPEQEFSEDDPDLRLESLFLCCACVGGDAAACRAFDAIYGQTIRDAVRRIDSSPSFVDEVAALCLDKLLVGSPPRLAQYTGRGELRAWVKKAASRAALDAKRKHRRLPEEQLAISMAIPMSLSPESAVFCRRHARDIVAALEHAISKLDTEERSLLRFYYVDGLNIDDIGKERGVHRATVARRLQRVRENIELTVRTELETSCGIDPSELASLVRGTREYQEARLRDLLAGL